MLAVGKASSGGVPELHQIAGGIAASEHNLATPKSHFHHRLRLAMLFQRLVMPAVRGKIMAVGSSGFSPKWMLIGLLLLTLAAPATLADETPPASELSPIEQETEAKITACHEEALKEINEIDPTLDIFHWHLEMVDISDRNIGCLEVIIDHLIADLTLNPSGKGAAAEAFKSLSRQMIHLNFTLLSENSACDFGLWGNIAQVSDAIGLLEDLARQIARYADSCYRP